MKLSSVIQKFSKLKLNSTNIWLVLVLLSGIISIIGIIPKFARSSGVDPAIPLSGDSAAGVAKVRAEGGSSYKIIAYDYRPEELARAIEASGGEVAIAVRGTGSLSGEQMADMVSAAIKSSSVKLPADKLFVSCCSNEPESNEPRPAAVEAKEFSDFINKGKANGDSEQYSQAWYTADTANSNYQNYLKQFIQFAGASAEEADYVAINCYDNCAERFNGLVNVYESMFNNPQLFIYETGGWPSKEIDFAAVANILNTCERSANCIDALLFNLYENNGEFNWHWDEFSDQQKLQLLQIGNAVYTDQRANELFAGYIRYLGGDTSFEDEYLEFMREFGTNLASLNSAMVSQNTLELDGISTGVDGISCTNEVLTYNYFVNRSNPNTNVSDYTVSLTYKITDDDQNGKTVGSGDLGGSPMYGNAPANTTGRIINFLPGYVDNLNHNVNFSQIQNGEIIFTSEISFTGNGKGYQRHTNECTVTVTNGQCVGVVCNAASTREPLCVPHNDSVKEAPPAQDQDAPGVSACNTGNQELTLEYAFGDGSKDIARYRLGFEILPLQGSQIVGNLITQNPIDPLLNSKAGLDDNTPATIANRLSTRTMQSVMRDGHVGVNVGNPELELDFPFPATDEKINATINSDISAGIDFLEYAFETICYLDSALSPDQAPCLKLLDGKDVPIEAYDDLANETGNTNYQNLRDSTLSCSNSANQKAYEGKNSDVYVGGSGSYFTEFDISRGTLKDNNPLVQRPILKVKVDPTLDVQRINWMISSLLSDEKSFMAQSFVSEENFTDYYNQCFLGAGNKNGAAGEVNYRLVLERRQPLECAPGTIRMADYEWRRVATSNTGTSYIPGLALIYQFMFQLPEEPSNSIPGATFRFEPTAENPCRVTTTYLPLVVSE